MHHMKMASYMMNCSSGRYGNYEKSYKEMKSILYPVNVARNIARETATTHFIFPLDIELYPSPGLIPAFLNMVWRNEPALRSPNPKVFVNPIFEIKKGFEMPVNKTDLVNYLLRGLVIPFHYYTCWSCHKIPDFDRWQQEDLRSGK